MQNNKQNCYKGKTIDLIKMESIRTQLLLVQQIHTSEINVNSETFIS